MYLFLCNALLTLQAFVGLILIGLILLQRGRGGGLAGAFGGMGGQSAFGTKAGDVFTRITIVVATIWIVLACVCILVINNRPQKFKAGGAAVVKAPADDKADKQAMDDKQAEKKPDGEQKDDGTEAKPDGEAEAKSNATEPDKSGVEKDKAVEKTTPPDNPADKKPE